MGKVGIIIINYNTFEDVKNCVFSIENTAFIEHEIIIVDNGSTDCSPSLLQKEYQNRTGYKVVCVDENRGYSAGCNAGARTAVEDNCEYLLFTNSDIVFHQDAVGTLVQALSNESIGIAGPRITTPNGEPAEFARNKLTFKTFIWTKKPLCYFNKNRQRYYQISFDKGEFVFEGMVSGCCFIMRTTLYLRENGFDESVFLYGEEDIWAYKLKNARKKAAIIKAATVFHNHHNSIKKKGMAFTRYYQWLSPLIVLRKYSNISNLKMRVLVYANIVIWLCLSIGNRDYRSFAKKFILDNKRLIQ